MVLGPRARKTFDYLVVQHLGTAKRLVQDKLIYKGLKKYKVDFVTSDRKVKKKTLIKKSSKSKPILKYKNSY